MTIYIKRPRSPIYRKIYEEHYGPIPKDDQGVSYDIHHIDGNPMNNDISNLVAVSRQEHYDIHYHQRDFSSCFSIAKRLNLSKEELSKLASFAGKIGGSKSRERVKNGTHNLLRRPDGSSSSGDRYKKGNHPFLKMKFDGRNNPRYDDTIYIFSNIDTGETVEMTQYDFVKHFSLENYKGNINSMIKHGKFRHVKRWTVLK